MKMNDRMLINLNQSQAGDRLEETSHTSLLMETFENKDTKTLSKKVNVTTNRQQPLPPSTTNTVPQPNTGNGRAIVSKNQQPSSNDPYLTNVNNTFNAYATKRTFATGLLDLALMSKNFTQGKQIMVAKRANAWQTSDVVLVLSIGLSVLLQFGTGAVMLFTAKQEFLDEAKMTEIMARNNLVIFLFLAITVINIFIDVFIV
jgi:hypothetical protein